MTIEAQQMLIFSDLRRKYEVHFKDENGELKEIECWGDELQKLPTGQSIKDRIKPL